MQKLKNAKYFHLLKAFIRNGGSEQKLAMIFLIGCCICVIMKIKCCWRK